MIQDKDDFPRPGVQYFPRQLRSWVKLSLKCKNPPVRYLGKVKYGEIHLKYCMILYVLSSVLQRKQTKAPRDAHRLRRRKQNTNCNIWTCCKVQVDTGGYRWIWCRYTMVYQWYAPVVWFCWCPGCPTIPTPLFPSLQFSSVFYVQFLWHASVFSQVP